MNDNYDFLLFDLDGTISDPLEGLTNSINYSLSYFGYEPHSKEKLSKFVGPPIDKIFMQLTNQTSREVINFLIKKFRERYFDVGFSENVLYEGIDEILSTLYQSGIPMGICTTKRKDFATKIVHLFGLQDYFRFIDGGDVGILKKHQIERLLNDGEITTKSLMIGDRNVDLVAAHSNGLNSAGVMWGYGTHKELLEENPKYIFEHPKDILRFIG